MICNDNESKMLLRLIKSERYSMIRHRSLRPSLSANTAENQQVRKLPPKLPPKMVILGVNFALTE